MVRLLWIFALAMSSTACIPFICVACDGLLAARGTVFEWIDAPAGAAGTAFVDRTVPSNLKVAPLAGAEIRLEPWLPSHRPSANAAASIRTVTSDPEGKFSVGIVVRPGNYSVTLKASAVGFKAIEQVFYHGTQRAHEVSILMVRTR
jgi:hypothetical protein